MHLPRLSSMSCLAFLIGSSLATFACSDSNDNPAPPVVTPDGGSAGPDASTAAPDAEAGVVDDGTANRPEQREFTEERMNALTRPAGFTVDAFATGVGNARMMWVDPKGGVYVTRPNSGDVILLRDANGDGHADAPIIVASNIENVHGIAVRDSKMYLAAPRTIVVADIATDGTLGTPQTIVSDLPDGGQHGKRTMRFGADGSLFVSVGSTCNNCEETNKENATLLKLDVSAKTRTTFATGLRNTLGFAWHPTTGELWGWDQGSDDRGPDTPPEELNLLAAGKDYGWPFSWGDRVVDKIANPPVHGTKEERAAASTPPALMYQAHSAAIDFIFYEGSQFPAEYRNDGFVAMRGSWNRDQPTGYKIVRVHFENGKPVSTSDFVAGWMLDNGAAQFGRPAGLATLPDGSLLVSEDTNGVIYRVRYTGTP